MNKEDKGKNLIGIKDQSYTDKEKLEIKNAKKIIKDIIKPESLSKDSAEFKKILSNEEQKIPLEDQ